MADSASLKNHVSSACAALLGETSRYLRGPHSLRVSISSYMGMRGFLRTERASGASRCTRDVARHGLAAAATRSLIVDVVARDHARSVAAHALVRRDREGAGHLELLAPLGDELRASLVDDVLDERTRVLRLGLPAREGLHLLHADARGHGRRAGEATG